MLTICLEIPPLHSSKNLRLKGLPQSPNSEITNFPTVIRLLILSNVHQGPGESHPLLLLGVFPRISSKMKLVSTQLDHTKLKGKKTLLACLTLLVIKISLQLKANI